MSRQRFVSKWQNTPIEADSVLSSYDAAELVQCDPASINKWIDAGHIPGFRTPGGHRRIRAIDLCGFMERQGMPIPAMLLPAQRA